MDNLEWTMAEQNVHAHHASELNDQAVLDGEELTEWRDVVLVLE